jgi:protein TonB
MFEKSLILSEVGHVSDRRSVWVFAVALQCTAAAVLLLLPMLRPEGMVVSIPSLRSHVPLDARRPKLAEVKPVKVSSEAATPRIPTATAERLSEAKIDHPGPASDVPFSEPSVSLNLMPEMLGRTVPAGVLGSPTPRVSAGGGGGAKALLRVSSGVGAGMLITPIRPVYPAIARAAHVSGSVVVEAVISRDGRIERARVVSGPALLAEAALQAIRAARYQPTG